MKFLCDQMLGTLAKWLRIFGFDTFYADSEIQDDELLKIAEKEKRILVTRDKELIVRGMKKKLEVIEIKTTSLDEQLKLVLKKIQIDKNNLLSRCLICNTVLVEISKNNVEGKVPERVFTSNERFWLCPKCDKIYWIGSHYAKMMEKLADVEKEAGKPL